MSLVGLNIGTQDSLAVKTRSYADYYRQLAAGTIKEVYDDETVSLAPCFYRSPIEKATFTKCKNMPSSGTFQSCTNLYHVDFPMLNQIGPSAFYGTSKLSSVFFPMVVDIVNSAFYASGVEAADFPMCTLIRGTAFQLCTKLKEIKIPLCEEISSRAFYSCSALEKIFLNAVTAVPTLGIDALAGTPDTLKIIVPDTLVKAFKADSNWSTYANKIIGMTEYEQTV